MPFYSYRTSLCSADWREGSGCGMKWNAPFYSHKVGFVVQVSRRVYRQGTASTYFSSAITLYLRPRSDDRTMSVVFRA